MRQEANYQTPMFQAHGTDDMVVKFQYGSMTSKMLSDLGIPVKFLKVDGMAHEADPDELTDLGKWLKERIGDPQGIASKGEDKVKKDEMEDKAKV
jgi:lysophospholipase I